MNLLTITRALIGASKRLHARNLERSVQREYNKANALDTLRTLHEERLEQLDAKYLTQNKRARQLADAGAEEKSSLGL